MNVPLDLSVETLRHRLAGLIDAHTPDNGAVSTAIAGLRLVCRPEQTEPAPCFYEPALTVVAQGAKTVMLGTARYIYDQSHCLFTAVDVPVCSQVTRACAKVPFLALSLRLDIEMTQALLAEIPPVPSPQTGTDNGAFAIAPVSSRLLDAFVRLVRLLDTPADIDVLAPLICREIHYLLLTGAQGAQLRRLAAADGRLRRIARAVNWLKTHYSEPCRIVHLAGLAGMSVSSLHHHFKAVTGQSPLQFHKQLRLQEARQQIFAGLDVASAGYRVGYESPSQFSRDYRRLFGLPPGRDSVQSRLSSLGD